MSGPEKDLKERFATGIDPFGLMTKEEIIEYYTELMRTMNYNKPNRFVNVQFFIGAVVGIAVKEILQCILFIIYR